MFFQHAISRRESPDQSEARARGGENKDRWASHNNDAIPKAIARAPRADLPLRPTGDIDARGRAGAVRLSGLPPAAIWEKRGMLRFNVSCLHATSEMRSAWTAPGSRVVHRRAVAASAEQKSIFDGHHALRGSQRGPRRRAPTLFFPGVRRTFPFDGDRPGLVFAFLWVHYCENLRRPVLPRAASAAFASAHHPRRK